jgi:hypothetical protein
MALLALGLTQAGCQKEGTPESGTNAQPMLTSSASLRADTQYVRGLTQKSPQGRAVLDLSDEAQYRFLRARVAAAGKTPEQFPQFFAMLESMRERHVARKRAGAKPLELAAGADHLIGGLVLQPDGRKFEASAFSTIQDGSDYSFIDVVVWNDEQTRQLSEYGWGEVYGDGRKLWARAQGTALAHDQAWYYVDSLSIVSVNGEEEYPVVQGVTTHATPGCEIVHPRDIAPVRAPDGIVTICLDRDYGDCDYPLVGHREIQIPLQGRMTFLQPVARINRATSYAKLVEENGGPHEMAFGSFGDYLQIDPNDPRTVTWSIPQHLGVFNGILFGRYEDVDLFLAIDVDLNRMGRLTNQKAMLSSTGTGTFACLPKIQAVYSCLAEGTLVQMGNGQSAPVESIAQGSQVVTDSSGAALSVADTSVGIEQLPMVRLEDDAGRSLLLTGSHPVVTPDQGVRWAEELKVGQQVLTDSGVSTLVKASREMYHGTVHNLKLDPSTLAYSRYAKGSTMYANGFLVGDLAMQRAFEFKNSAKPSADVLAKLPAHWRGDYENSVKLGKLTARR